MTAAIVWNVCNVLGVCVILTALVLTQCKIVDPQDLSAMTMNLIGGGVLTIGAFGFWLLEDDKGFIPYAVLNLIWTLTCSINLFRLHVYVSDKKDPPKGAVVEVSTPAASTRNDVSSVA